MASVRKIVIPLYHTKTTLVISKKVDSTPAPPGSDALLLQSDSGAGDNLELQSSAGVLLLQSAT